MGSGKERGRGGVLRVEGEFGEFLVNEAVRIVSRFHVGLQRQQNLPGFGRPVVQAEELGDRPAGDEQRGGRAGWIGAALIRSEGLLQVVKGTGVIAGIVARPTEIVVERREPATGHGISGRRGELHGPQIPLPLLRRIGMRDGDHVGGVHPKILEMVLSGKLEGGLESGERPLPLTGGIVRAPALEEDARKGTMRARMKRQQGVRLIEIRVSRGELVAQRMRASELREQFHVVGGIPGRLGQDREKLLLRSGRIFIVPERVDGRKCGHGGSEATRRLSLDDWRRQDESSVIRRGRR